MSNRSKERELASRIEALAAPIVADVGATVYDVEVGRYGSAGLVRLVVDRAGDDEAPGGITIEEITRIAKEVGYLLDAEDVVGFSHRFEVSSPGIERSLRSARHFAQNLGRDVRVVLSSPAASGTVVVEGKLDQADDERAAVITDGGEIVEFEIGDVRRARTVYDFGVSTQENRRSKDA